MNGSCHAAIQHQQRQLRRSAEVAPAEEFCGLKRVSKPVSYRASSADEATTQKYVSLARTCDADCGSYAAGAVSAKGKLAIAPAYLLQPLRISWSIGSPSVSSNEAFNRRYSPRGPPAVLT